MGYKSDIEIAQECQMLPITEIAAKAGISDEYLEQYGKYKAKIDYKLLKDSDRKDGKLILVTAMNPTPAGEGKTTTTIGLADGLQKLGKKVMVALREPSLGPVFGVKGGAAGGGYAQVVPMEDINLHFTGDFHAIGAANNLLAAMIDNHIYQGNELNIDPRKITWKRCVDMNDRQLRFVVDGLGGRVNGTPREDGYDITVAPDGTVYLVTGDNAEDNENYHHRVEKYNADGTWSQVGGTIDYVLSSRCYSKIAVAPDGTVFVAYPNEGASPKTIDVVYFDAATKQWSAPVSLGNGDGVEYTGDPNLSFVFDSKGKGYLTWIEDSKLLMYNFQ